LLPSAVHAAIKRLRRKLRDAGVDVRIDSVRGVGYQLVTDDN
jgi:two-component system, OmpR family, response regulator MtrA